MFDTLNAWLGTDTWIHIGADIAVKATLIGLPAFLLTSVVFRRAVLIRSSIWNACLVGLLLLPLATVVLPSWRIYCLPGPAMDVLSGIIEATNGDKPDRQGSDIDPAVGEHNILDGEIEPLANPLPFFEAAGAEHGTAGHAALSERVTPWWPTAAMLVYLAGAIVLAIRLLRSALALRRLRKSAVTLDDPGWVEALKQWRDGLGVTAPVAIGTNGEVTVPIVFGLRRPMILLPEVLAESATVKQREAILLHELAHVRRNDYFWQIVLHVVRVIYWPHPLFWPAWRIVAATQEQACDALCVHHLAGPRDYASTLIDVAKGLAHRPAAALGIAMARTSRISRRLSFVTRTRGIAQCLARRPVRLSILALAVIAASCLAPVELARKSAADEGNNATQPAGQEASLPPLRPLFGFDRDGQIHPLNTKAASSQNLSAENRPTDSSSSMIDDAARIQCPMERVTVSWAESGNETYLAASFMFGEYARNPRDRKDLLSSRTLWPRFESMPEEQRWTYPEYALIKDFLDWKSGDHDAVLACYQEGSSRDSMRARIKESKDEIKALIDKMQLKEVLFLYKAYYGPYIYISYCWHEMPTDSTRKGRALPGSRYLKLVDGRYVITDEIGDTQNTHPFTYFASHYGYGKVVAKKTFVINPNVHEMSWAAFDVDSSKSDGTGTLRAFSPGVKPSPFEIPTSFSDNHLVIYFRHEPVMVHMVAGQKQPNLSDKLRFIESAITAHALGPEEDIIKHWEEGSADNIRNNIKLLKDGGAWPEQRRSPWGKETTIMSIIPIASDKSLIIYYRKKPWFISNMALFEDKDRNSWLLAYNLGGNHVNITHLFRHELLTEVLIEQYGGKHSLNGKTSPSRNLPAETQPTSWEVSLPPPDMLQADAAVQGLVQALRDSEWTKAIGYCSAKVQNAAKAYPSAEAFVRDVVPIQQLVTQTKNPIYFKAANLVKGGPWQMHGLGFSIAELEPDPADKWSLPINRQVWWQGILEKEDTRSVVDFPTSPLNSQIETRLNELRRLQEKAIANEMELEPKLKGLRTRLTPLAKRFQIGKPMLFRLELINDGPARLVYDHSGAGINDSMMVTTKQGSQIPYTAGPFQTTARHEIIDPGTAVILLDKWNLAKQYQLTEPGHHTVQFRGGIQIAEVDPRKTVQVHRIDSNKIETMPDAGKRSLRRFPSNTVEIELVATREGSSETAR